MKTLIGGADPKEFSVQPVEARRELTDPGLSVRGSEHSEFFAVASNSNGNSGQRLAAVPYSHHKILPHFDPLAETASD